MPGDPYRNMSVGDDVTPVFNTRRHNDLNALLKRMQASNPILSGSQVGGANHEGLIYIRNDASDVVQYGVLGITGVLVDEATNSDEFKSNWALTGITPTSADHTGKFVITAEPIAAGEIGRAFVFGVTPVQISFGSADDTYADVSDGVAGNLASSGSGAARILWSAATSGTVWALVRFGGSGDTINWGVLTAPWASGNTITLTPCVGPIDNTGTGAADITCYIQIPVSSPAQYLGANTGDILGYVVTSGINVLFQVPLPRMGRKGDAWYNNAADGAATNVVADFFKSRA